MHYHTHLHQGEVCNWNVNTLTLKPECCWPHHRLPSSYTIGHHVPPATSLAITGFDQCVVSVVLAPYDATDDKKKWWLTEEATLAAV